MIIATRNALLIALQYFLLIGTPHILLPLFGTSTSPLVYTFYSSNRTYLSSPFYLHRIRQVPHLSRCARPTYASFTWRYLLMPPVHLDSIHPNDRVNILGVGVTPLDLSSAVSQVMSFLKS